MDKLKAKYVFSMVVDDLSKQSMTNALYQRTMIQSNFNKQDFKYYHGLLIRYISIVVNCKLGFKHFFLFF